MESQEPGKNDDTVGLSKRRISSILKVSQKSSRFSEFEPQVHTVECAKPVEKRSSRRVSFAPANDVLLFSKDVKSASPPQSPLQELITATAATTNRVQTAIAEDGIQPTMGMETLLNAPLHASQQKDGVTFDVGENFGEKTIMFSADDFMDMTHSHTVNTDNCAELTISLDNCDALTSSRERTAMLIADSGSKDITMCNMFSMMSGSESLPGNRNVGLSVEGEILSTSVPCLDLEFENFLASLRKSSGPFVNPVIAKMIPARASSRVKNCSLRQINDVDKENKVPTCAYVAVDKSSTSKKICESSYVSAFRPEGDVSKDITETPAGRTQGTADDDFFKCLFPTQEMYAQSDKRASQTLEIKSKELQRNEMLRSSDPKGMETSLKPSLKTEKVNLVAEDDCKERTLWFTASDATMDVTQCHTVNIAAPFDPETLQNVDLLSTGGEKTVRFTSNDAAMDVTQSHTVNTDVTLVQKQTKSVDLFLSSENKTLMFDANDPAVDVTRSINIATNRGLASVPTYGEKTERFTASDAAIDVTKSHTVNIAAPFDPWTLQNIDLLSTDGEKTVRFTANDAAMDVTQSHTVDAAAFDPQSHKQVNLFHTSGERIILSANDTCMDVTRSHTATNLKQMSQNADSASADGEKPVRFTADAAVDVTKSHSVNIAAAAFEPQSSQNIELLPCVERPVGFTSPDSVMDVAQIHTVAVASKPVLDSVHLHQDPNIISTHKNMDLSPTVKETEGDLSKNSNEKQMSGVSTENEAPSFVLDTMEKLENEAMAGCLEGDIRTTEVETSCILGQTCTNDLPRDLCLKQDLCCNSDHLRKTEATLLQHSGEPVLSEGLEALTCPGFLDTNETESGKQPKMTNETSPVLNMMASSPSAALVDDELRPQNSRQKRLANLQSKIKRLSNMINASPDTVDMDNCTVPLPQVNHDLDENSTDKLRPFPLVGPDPDLGFLNSEVGTQAQCLEEGEQASTAFNLKTKQLVSRLSVGGFKPKLPQRSKPDDPKKVTSMGEHARAFTVNPTSHMANFESDVSDIYDEELGSFEEMSEVLDERSPQKDCVNVSCSQEFNMDEPLEDFVFEEDHISAVHGQKRRLPEDENNMEHEKRLKTSTEMTTDTADVVHSEMDLQSGVLESDGHVTAASTSTAQTTDLSNSSHTASSRCEATFESTFKHSLFESQLEDYANDVQKKCDDGTISVSEFFKLFNIDFVIHDPRQSVLPGRHLSDTDRTSMDLLKDRHINHPKQLLYEADVLNLTEKVEGLKVRLRDLDKPLRLVNRPLWEEIRNLSEKELKSFGAKLKERNNFFRKMSKAHSHEMKEILYSNIVQANLKAQQTLRGRTEKADEMIKSLDDCIHDLETELAAVEEKGFGGKPGLKSRQEELKKVNEALADNERQMSELEVQKMQSSTRLNQLEAETRNLENHITMLHVVNEWKLGKKKDNCTIYTFLHDTMHLQVVYKKSNGNNADNGPEQKISDITFRFLLDYDESKCNARLVHKLLSRYFEERSAWVEKYPTSRHVPQLLHDVGLVVSRCRLLGEELRLLETWGSLRLDILDISVVDTRVHIVFSSLKKFAKFEVVFSINLINELCVIQLLSFSNRIGNTTIQQVEEIVASFSPGRKVLTKILKRIHEDLLC